MSKRLQRALKRAMDVVGSATLLTATAPALGVTALLVKKKLGPGPVLFRQVRPGLHGEPFEAVKFRSMLEAFDEEGNILPEGERMHPFGWFLRKHSLDEFPGLWNVLRGDMSLVGPRPLLMEYLEHYPEEFRRRHDVKPGLTGWAQVSGRHNLTFRQRLEHDVWYVDHWSLALDLKILLMTFGEVLFPDNVKPPDQDPDEVDDMDWTAVKQTRRKDAR
ncbi:MAG: sugar transferase [Myxococcota bacterium]